MTPCLWLCRSAWFTRLRLVCSTSVKYHISGSVNTPLIQLWPCWIAFWHHAFKSSPWFLKSISLRYHYALRIFEWNWNFFKWNYVFVSRVPWVRVCVCEQEFYLSSCCVFGQCNNTTEWTLASTDVLGCSLIMISFFGVKSAERFLGYPRKWQNSDKNFLQKET